MFHLVGLEGVWPEIEKHEQIIALSTGGDSKKSLELIIEDIAQALGKDEREDELLILRRILCTTNAAGGVPDPALK